MSEETNTSVKKRSLNYTNLAILLVLLAAVGAAIYFWQDARDARNQTPEAIAARNQEDSERVLTKLDKILLTESDQEPTVARIEDANVLREANSDFYKNAENGDYLVLYPQRAIIYREADNRVINVAPIINTSQLPTPDQTDTGGDTQTEQPTN